MSETSTHNLAEPAPTFSGGQMFARLRRTAKWGVPAAALVWVGWIGLVDQRAIEPGPVSTAHAMFGHDCGRCHVASRPDSWQSLTEVALSPVPDASCVVCHDGAEHHGGMQTPDVTHRCVDCHREHRDHAQLARVADAQCTACHANLDRTGVAEHNFATSIDSWADHPEFALLRPSTGGNALGPKHGVRQVAVERDGHWQDRGRIKLNHAVHLDPRGVLHRDGVRRVLDCSACHVPDHNSGYMLPINHEQHCQACHENQLLFDSTIFPERPAPHVDAAQVRGTLREMYASHFAANAGNPATPSRRDPLLPTMQVSPENELRINDLVANASRVLFEQKGTGCSYCHNDVNMVDGQWTVGPADIPVRWLSQSAFRHDSHRMLTCRECHPKAGDSRQTSDILLPGITVCRNCHQRPAWLSLSSAGVARSDCAECHIYHEHEVENYNGPLDVNLQQIRPEGRRPPVAPAARTEANP